MALCEEKQKEYGKRLLLSRMRILNKHGFYGLLLMHVVFSLDESCETAATDGHRIFFNPQFLDELSDAELDFVLMHEILHVVLQHCLRQGERDNERFNVACDIVVNSNILLSENMAVKAITLKKYGVGMHLIPNGAEGYEYTAEEVYEMLSFPSRRRSKDAVQRGRGKALTRAEKGASPKQGKPCGKSSDGAAWDDHARWGTVADDALRDVWLKRFEDACEAISVRGTSNQGGGMPLFAERIWKEMKRPQTDWRKILNDFVQEEICDYSFSPPDRRFAESPFFFTGLQRKGGVLGKFVVYDRHFRLDDG